MELDDVKAITPSQAIATLVPNHALARNFGTALCIGLSSASSCMPGALCEYIILRSPRYARRLSADH